MSTDYLITVRQLSDNCPTTVRQMSVKCPTTVQQLFDNCSTTVRQLSRQLSDNYYTTIPYDCLTIVRQLSDDCYTTVPYWLFDDCPMTATQLYPTDCLMTVMWLSNDCPMTVRRLLEAVPKIYRTIHINSREIMYSQPTISPWSGRYNGLRVHNFSRIYVYGTVYLRNCYQ
jgi:hypothetical protein